MKDAYKLFFGSLNNQNRLKIINTLQKGPKHVNEICKLTGFKQTTVSHNLKRLQKCGMVFVSKNGKHREYTVNQKTIKPLLRLIDKHIKQYCHKIIQGEKR